MVLEIIVSTTLLGCLTYLFWPTATLAHRRGAIYRTAMDEMVIVVWDFWFIPVEVTYVKCMNSYYGTDTTCTSLADLGRRASNFEARVLDELLAEDLRTLTVTKILDDYNITILTKSGARFDLEYDLGWTFRHNGQPVDQSLGTRIYREVRKNRSAQIVTRSNRNAF